MGGKIADIINDAVLKLSEEQVQEFFENQNRILWIDDNILSENNVEFSLLRAEYAEDMIHAMVDRWDEEYIKSIGA